MKKLILTLALSAFTLGLMAASDSTEKPTCPMAGKTCCEPKTQVVMDKAAACPMKQAACCKQAAAKTAAKSKPLMSPKALALAGK